MNKNNTNIKHASYQELALVSLVFMAFSTTIIMSGGTALGLLPVINFLLLLPIIYSLGAILINQHLLPKTDIKQLSNNWQYANSAAKAGFFLGGLLTAIGAPMILSVSITIAVGSVVGVGVLATAIGLLALGSTMIMLANKLNNRVYEHAHALLPANRLPMDVGVSSYSLVASRVPRAEMAILPSNTHAVNDLHHQHGRAYMPLWQHHIPKDQRHQRQVASDDFMATLPESKSFGRTRSATL